MQAGEQIGIVKDWKKKRKIYSITIAGLNGRAVAPFAWPLDSASAMWTGTPNSRSRKAFADSKTARSFKGSSASVPRSAGAGGG